MTQFIRGEGPVPCDVMVIGEAPGRDEDRYGRPFVGKSGKELDRYLWRVLNIPRDKVFVTNIVKNWTGPGDPDPTAAQIEHDRGFLEEELRHVQPVYIITLGRFATRNFLGDVDMDTVHGVPHVLATGVCILPCFHPAAGLHNTESQALIQYDFGVAAQVIRGELDPAPPEDEHPEPTYSDVGYIHSPAAVDTEGSAGRPWCATFSCQPGHATIIKKGPAHFGHIILHSSLHDLPVLRAMGITFDSFDDTMEAAYLLCIEPQGLKQLAKRHCGMDMHSYTDLTDPYRLKKQNAYLKEVLKCLDNLSLQERSTPLGTAPPRPKKVKKKPTPRTAGRRSGKTSSRRAGARR